MANVAVEDPDPFSCPICLDPLESPVTIPCGHNYCIACIKDYWDDQEHTKTCSCPECRESFTPRPVLNKNTMFAEVVERFRQTKLRDSSPAQSAPRKCSICTGQKVQTVKFCPQCKEKCCEPHGAQHNSTSPREKHTVIVVGGEPSKNVCLHHNMPLEIFCRTDQQLICSLCFVERHRDHDVVSVKPRNTGQVEKPSQRRRHHRHRSHDHSRRKHRSRHASGHGNSKGEHKSGHHASRGRTLGRHGHTEGGGLTTGRDRSGRHGTWRRSSRHGRRRHQTP